MCDDCARKKGVFNVEIRVCKQTVNSSASFLMR